MSSLPGVPSVFTPAYPPHSHPDTQESEATQHIIDALHLEKHIEGGYFAEIDRNPLLIPNPFLRENKRDGDAEKEEEEVVVGKTVMSGDDGVRNASTSIYYMLSPTTPQGHFHRNMGRTVHTLIEGRGRYVLIHADEEGSKKRVESFVVGKDVAKGEKSVWVVEGGKFKASYLLEGAEGERLLISETVIPGFEYSDHDFLTIEKFRDIVTGEQAEELEWLVRKS